MMTPEDVLAELSTEQSVPPREVLAAADEQREALVGPLLQVIERGLTDSLGATAEDAALFCYAVYLLAKWREARAYPLIIRWLSLPGEGAFDIAGDVPTQDGARILAAVCHGNLDPMKSLVLNRSANEFCRSVALSALALLAAWGEVAYDSDRKSTRLNSSHIQKSRMPSSA